MTLAPTELGELSGAEHNVGGRSWGEEGRKIIAAKSGNQDVPRAIGAAEEFGSSDII